MQWTVTMFNNQYCLFWCWWPGAARKWRSQTGTAGKEDEHSTPHGTVRTHDKENTQTWQIWCTRCSRTRLITNTPSFGCDLGRAVWPSFLISPGYPTKCCDLARGDLIATHRILRTRTVLHISHATPSLTHTRSDNIAIVILDTNLCLTCRFFLWMYVMYVNTAAALCGSALCFVPYNHTHTHTHTHTHLFQLGHGHCTKSTNDTLKMLITLI